MRQLPKLEIVADKPMKRGMFYLGTKNGEKMPLGETVDIVYLDRGMEVRALMADGDDKPRCAARDGLPYTEGQLSPTCGQCIYNTWPDNKPYKDAEGLRCRTKRHIVCDVIVDDALVPAILVVPPTSLKNERNYRGDVASMSRMKGRGSVMSAVTRLSSRFVQDAMFSYSVVEFKHGGSLTDKLAPEKYLLFLKDKQALQAAKIQHEAYNDIKAAQEVERGATKPAPPKPKKAKEYVSEEVTGGGSDDDLPF
jgi:hypothetical protein